MSTYEYKCVAAPKQIIIDSENYVDKAMQSFADIINRETYNGWEFYSIHDISTTTPNGCLSSLLGFKNTVTVRNMLIFRKPKGVKDTDKEEMEKMKLLKMYKDKLDFGLIEDSLFEYYKTKLFPENQ